MRVIFCSDYWDKRLPDPAYRTEAEMVEKLGVSYSLIDYEALLEAGNVRRAVRNVESAEGKELALYRGWMLKPRFYELLYQALAAKGLLLINTPTAYRHCHYLPESYPVLAGFTPLSTWLLVRGEVSMDAVMEALRPFGAKPIIVKDFVKSQKHAWYEACYIPSAADKVMVERVVKRFLQLQGEDLNEGLVFREFVEFEPLAIHSKSGMPLSQEYRLFILDGQTILSSAYWEEGDYTLARTDSPPLEEMHAIARKVESRFFSMDVARRKDGTWTIVELGDGQVAGLPAGINLEVFYQVMTEKLSG